MSTRRTTPKPNPDLDRLASNLNHKMEALLQGFDSLRKDVLLVQQDVRFEAQQRQALASDLQHLAKQVADMRDTVTQQQGAKIEAAAKSAVQEAVPVVQSAAVRAAKPANWKAWVALVAVVFVSIATFAEKAPAALGWIERIWIASKGEQE